MPLILGSQSPRRQEILGYFSIPFKQVAPSFDEGLVPFEGDPALHAQILAEGKAETLAPDYPNDVILTADTLVFKEGKLFMKPADEQEALAMLLELNGSCHSVFTALTAQSKTKRITKYQETRVFFHKLTPAQLQRYHQTFDGTDKAGGYGIQTAGSIIVKKMEGCFYNVMGMPITALRKVLYEVGIDLWSYLS